MIDGQIQQINNFFNYFPKALQYFKEVPLYSNEEYNERLKKNFPDNFEKENWPGQRSDDLAANGMFTTYLMSTMKQHKIWMPERFSFKAHVHLRLNDPNDKDWIHHDAGQPANEPKCFKTLLVYLSPTNLSSGTNFYLQEDPNTLFTTIGFVQNSAVHFTPGILHSSKSNYGDSKENGRLTLNVFFYEL